MVTCRAIFASVLFFRHCLNCTRAFPRSLNSMHCSAKCLRIPWSITMHLHGVSKVDAVLNTIILSPYHCGRLNRNVRYTSLGLGRETNVVHHCCHFFLVSFRFFCTYLCEFHARSRHLQCNQRPLMSIF